MTRHLLAAAAILALPGPAWAAPVAANGITLQSTTVNLPTGDLTFPGGKPADAINNNCLACHSAEMVLDQPKLTRAQWQGEVDKMRALYKAPVDTKDVPAIVDYLATNPGLHP